MTGSQCKCCSARACHTQAGWHPRHGGAEEHGHRARRLGRERCARSWRSSRSSDCERPREPIGAVALDSGIRRVDSSPRRLRRESRTLFDPVCSRRALCRAEPSSLPDSASLAPCPGTLPVSSQRHRLLWLMPWPPSRAWTSGTLLINVVQARDAHLRRGTSAEDPCCGDLFKQPSCTVHAIP